MPLIAAAQIETRLLDLEANLEKILRRMKQASQQGAELVVFPECALTGYNLTPDEALEIAEPVPGPSTARLQAACSNLGIMTVIGMLEAGEDESLFNTAVLIGADGVLASYRKTHLPFLGLDRYMMQGNRICSPVDTPIGRLGMLICYDLRFPEPMRVLALAGAQVVLLPTAWPRAASLYPEYMARSRSMENTLYLVAANRVGEERGAAYLGRSVICGPEGEMLAEAGSDEDQLLLVDVDPARSEQKRKIFIPGEYELDSIGDRRPELYQAICDPQPTPSPGS